MRCIIGRIELKKPMKTFEAKCRLKTAVSHCWSSASLIHDAPCNCSLRLEMLVFWARPPHLQNTKLISHYSDVIMSAMASQITGGSIVCSVACLGADQIKHQSSASLTFVRGIHRWLVDSPHKGPVTPKMLPFDDVIVLLYTKFSAVTISEKRHGINHNLIPDMAYLITELLYKLIFIFRSIYIWLESKKHMK